MTSPPPTSLWSLADALDETEARAQARSPRGVDAARRLRWVVDAAPTLALITALAVGVHLPPSLAYPARAALFAFGLAVIAWSTTRLNTAYVALGAVLLLVLTGGAPQEELFEALASDVVWLMIGAFVLGAAVRTTGLAGRLTTFVTRRARTINGLFWLITAALLPLTLLIPSTSGRAAVVLPVFRSLADAAGNARVTRGLALLFPTIILVTTTATLVGAGSHLIANDLLEELSGRRISFLQWLAFGLPFAAVAGALSCFVVLRLFLNVADRRQILAPETFARPRPLSTAEAKTLAITLGMMGLWLSEPWHGVEVATTSVLGAMALAAPVGGVLKWKDALKAVSWDLIVFVGAALVLGTALIETGAAGWIIERMFAASGLSGAHSTLFFLLGLSLITLTSHVYMTSHAARAVALVPPLLYLGQALGLDPVAVMFIGTVGMNYCLTFPVSSKALLMFQALDEPTFEPNDLLRLSAVLLMVHVGLIVLFYFGYWRWIGLAL